MNKADLSRAVAEKTGLTLKTSEAAINAMLEAISDALAGSQAVKLIGFGTFEVKNRAARMGRNPKTKEAIVIEASKAPVFKPGALLKAAIRDTL